MNNVWLKKSRFSLRFNDLLVLGSSLRILIQFPKLTVFHGSVEKKLPPTWRLCDEFELDKSSSAGLGKALVDGAGWTAIVVGIIEPVVIGCLLRDFKLYL